MVFVQHGNHRQTSIGVILGRFEMGSERVQNFDLAVWQPANWWLSSHYGNQTQPVRFRRWCL